MRKRAEIFKDCLDAMNEMQPMDRKFVISDKLYIEVLVDIRDILQKGLKILEILSIDHAKTPH